MFRLEFETDNAAFAEDMEAEVSRILRMVASQIRHELVLDGERAVIVRDVNGNTVGTWQYTPGEA